MTLEKIAPVKRVDPATVLVAFIHKAALVNCTDMSEPLIFGRELGFTAGEGKWASEGFGVFCTMSPESRQRIL